MKRVLLATSRNSLYREDFERAGFTVAEAPAAEGEGGEQRLECFPGDFAIVEFSDGSSDPPVLLERLRAKGARLIGVTGRFGEAVRKLLAAVGVADCFLSLDVDGLVRYVALAHAQVPGGEEHLLVLDDSAPRRAIIQSIAERFNYHAVFTVKADEFFDAARRLPSLAVVNIGAPGFSVGAFVKQWMADSSLKRVPCLPCKDMDEGLFVHELVSGLNRIAKAILSPEELYSFLLVMLFRREIAPLAERLARLVDLDALGDFAREPLARIYFNRGPDTGALGRILSGNEFASLKSAAESLQKTLVKTAGLRWMLREESARPTCGPRGA